MKIAITAESTIDLKKEILDEYDIKTVPFTLLLGDETRADGEVTTDEIIEFVNRSKILPKTSAVNEYQYEEFFGNILKDNDAIIHFSLSSTMSSAYSNAVLASKKFKNVYIVDTASLSTGIALLAVYARKLTKKDLSPKDIYEKCLERIPFVQASFVLNRLDYLYKGGRCSALSLFGANLLKIKPQIVVKDGVMVPGKKYRGSYDLVVKNYVNDTLESFNNYDLDTVFITYTTMEDFSLVDYVRDILKEYGFKNIYLTRANGTITSHCGENCFGILYFNDGNNHL